MATNTLYFGKINYNSEIHKIHSKELKLDDINKKILSFLQSGITYDEKILGKKEEKDYSKEYKYELYGLEIRDDKIIMGNISKNDFIYKKTINKKKEIITKEKIESEESILFYYDVYKEIVAFHTTNKFGYKKFIEVFGLLLNKSFEKEKDPDRFEVVLKNNASSIEDIFLKISSLGKIKEIRIDIIPPNPDDEIIEDIENKSKDVLKNMGLANATRKSTLFSTNSSEGLKIDSDIITDSINEMSDMHEALNVETFLAKGYGEISAVNESGDKFSTNDNKPLKHEIPEDKKNKAGFFELVGGFINKL